jgi:rod shape-determining protein MreC
MATAIRSTVLAPVLQLQSGFSDMQLVRGQVEALRAERDSLSAHLHALSNVDEENLRLRGLVGLAQRVGHTFQPANLTPVGRAGEVVQRSFVLDAGESSGIAADAPVVAPGGLVGVVRVISLGRATGDFWTHPEFRVSAMTADGNVFGIIKSLGAGPLLMQLDGAPYQLELASGTQLVTSGQGGVFPRGIPIGRVIEVVSAEEGWSKSYLVRPSVYPDAVREVMVLVDSLGAVDPADVWGWVPADTLP